MRGRRRRGLLPLLLLPVLALTGCWDYLDLEQQALITGLGFDAVPDDPTQVLFSAEVPIPIGVDPGGGGGRSGGGGGASPRKRIATTRGASVSQAANDLRGVLERNPLWQHTLVVLVSEEVARQGIAGVMDTSLRLRELNRRARVYLAAGRAQDVLRHQPTTQPLVGRYLRSLSDQFASYPKFAPAQSLATVHVLLQEEGVALVPRVIFENDEIRLDGAGVLSAGRLVGWLHAREAEGASWLLGLVKRSLVRSGCPGEPAGLVAGWAQLEGRRIRVAVLDGVPHVRYEISASVRLVQMSRCPLKLESPDRQRIADGLATVVEGLAEAAVRRAQRELQVDFLGAGEQVRRHSPALRAAGDWHRRFPRVPISVEVRIAPGGISYPGDRSGSVPYP